MTRIQFFLVTSFLAVLVMSTSSCGKKPNAVSDGVDQALLSPPTVPQPAAPVLSDAPNREPAVQTLGTITLVQQANAEGGGAPQSVGTKELGRVSVGGNYKKINTVKGRWNLTGGVYVGN